VKKVVLLFALVCLGTANVLASITVWVSWEGEDWFRQVAGEFSAQTGENVEIVHFPAMEEKLAMTVQAGGPFPDVCLVKTDLFPLLDTLISPIFFDQLSISPSEIQELGTQAFSQEEALMALPLYADVQVLYLNRAVFQQAGIPLPQLEDWDLQTLQNTMEALEAQGTTPLAWGLNSAYIFMGLQDGLGSPLLDPEGNFQVDTPENVVLTKMLLDWFERGWIADYPQRPPLVKAFQEGKVAMMPQGSFLLQTFQKKGLDFALLPFPSPWRTVIDPKAFVVFHPSPNAWKLLDLMERRSHALCAQTIKIPMWKTEKAEEIPYLPFLLASLQNGVLQPQSAQFSNGYWPAIRGALELILYEKQTPEIALSIAQQYIDHQ